MPPISMNPKKSPRGKPAAKTSPAQLLHDAVSAVVTTKGWQVGGGSLSLVDQLTIAFATAGLVPMPAHFEKQPPTYSGFKISPGYRSVTVWEFDVKTNRRVGVHRCTPDQKLSREQRVGVVRRFMRDHNLAE